MEGSIDKKFGNVLDSGYGVGRDERVEEIQFRLEATQNKEGKEQILVGD